MAGGSERQGFWIGREGGGGHYPRFSSYSSLKVITKSHRNRDGNLDHVRLLHDIKKGWKSRRSLVSSVEHHSWTRARQLVERGDKFLKDSGRGTPNPRRDGR